jgi:hypothetical protein
MGQSTDAILIYGVHLQDHTDEQHSGLPWAGQVLSEDDGYTVIEDGDDDWADTLVRRANARGENLPAYPDDGCFEARRKLEDDCLIEPVSHCSSEYPMWIIGVKSSMERAYRGGPIDFDNGFPQVSDAEKKALKEWCEEFDIPHEPKWILCSNWG